MRPTTFVSRGLAPHFLGHELSEPRVSPSSILWVQEWHISTPVTCSPIHRNHGTMREA